MPHSSFDYAPASLDPILVELGVKERESLKFPLAHAVCFERDARTMSLIAFFLDMSGASACNVLEEANQNQELPKKTKDALQCLSDLERSRGHAVLHMLFLLATMDTNMKLFHRSKILSASEIQPHLLQAAYQIHFDQSGNRLFGEGLAIAMALNDDYVSKRHTQQLDQVILKQLSTKSTRTKQPAQAHSQQQQHPQRGRRKSKRTPSSSPAPGPRSYPPKEDKPHVYKPDRRKNNFS